MRHATMLATVMVLAFAGLSTSAQEVVVDVNLRMFDVSVEDGYGVPVLDLTADDLEVLENGLSKPVKHLSLETQPVAVGLVVDRSSSVQAVKDKVDQAVVQVLANARPVDQVFLMTFAGTGKLNVGLTTRHQSVLESLRKTKLAYGTRLYDAIASSIDYLSASSFERRILIVFSDGADHYSTHTLEQVLETAAAYGIQIYTVAYAGDDSRTWTAQGRREIQNQFEQLAGMTGGKSFFPTGTDCSRIARQILDRTRYEYRLGFYSSNPLAFPSDVQIKLRGNGPPRRLTIRIPPPWL